MTRATATLILLLCMLAHAAPASPWRFEAGISAGQPTPVMVEAAVGYKAITAHMEGFGVYKGENDFWCGLRGGLGWTFLRELPFRIDIGVGGGYEFAEAPNKMHQALNEANGAMYLYPYNYKESLDISAEVRVHIFGFFTQVGYPIHYFMKHDEPTILWRAGYLAEF